MLINYKGHNYLVAGEAYSVNDGKYYVCFRQDGTEEIARLIPSDSKEVRIIIKGTDLVQVVRCKDCKFRENDDFCTGRGFPYQLVPDGGFCDKGERAEE